MCCANETIAVIIFPAGGSLRKLHSNSIITDRSIQLEIELKEIEYNALCVILERPIKSEKKMKTMPVGLCMLMARLNAIQCNAMHLLIQIKRP